MPARKRTRLDGYDYASAGAYFVTIVVSERDTIFGNVVGASVELNRIGQIIRESWHELPQRFPSVALDAFVIMPNHIHGILILDGSDGAVSTKGAASSAPTIGIVLRAFKSISAIAVNKEFVRHQSRLWQRGYYDHIVRDERDLNRIREYIELNPLQWANDSENPSVA